MKYSLLMPYYNRIKQFKNTLASFRHFYSQRNDFEIIIVEDIKNQKNNVMHNELIEVINNEKNIKILRIEYQKENCYNPSEMFNMAASKSNGDFLILTNPEIMHKEDVLSGFDRLLSNNSAEYLVCYCMSILNVSDSDDFKQITYNINPKTNWYVHSKWNHRYLHFCSVLRKDLFTNIGGFDIQFVDGIGYEDTDFAKKIYSNKIKARLVNFVVLHQDHDRNYDLDTKEKRRRCDLNYKIFKNKWGPKTKDIVYKEVYDKAFSNPKYNVHLKTEPRYQMLLDRIESGSSVLDIGSGRGVMIELLLEQGIKVTSLDINKYHNLDVPFVQVDITKTDFVLSLLKGNRFDYITCLDVLEHLRKEDLVCLNVFSKLADKYIISVSNHSDVLNGVQLHLIQEPNNFWENELKKYMKITSSFQVIPRCTCFCGEKLENTND